MADTDFSAHFQKISDKAGKATDELKPANQRSWG